MISMLLAGSLVAQELPEDGKLLWLKADAGVETDSEGRVVSWKDQSGQGIDAAQPVEVHRPTLDSAGLNGLPALQFRGESGLWLATSSIQLPSKYTIVSVIDIQKIQHSVLLSQPSQSGEGGVNALSLAIGSAPDRNLNGVVVRTARGNASSNWGATNLQWLGRGPAIVTLVFDGADGNQSVLCYLNGEVAGMSGGAFGPSYDQPLIIGGLATGWPSLGGDVSEILIYDGVLNHSDRKSAETALATKYGISMAQ